MTGSLQNVSCVSYCDVQWRICLFFPRDANVKIEVVLNVPVFYFSLVYLSVVVVVVGLWHCMYFPLTSIFVLC